MKKINLTYGNPTFLNEYWKRQDLLDGDLYYPYPYMSKKNSEQLEEAIRSCHRAIGNVKDVGEYKIVLGHGATQLLTGLISVIPGDCTTAPKPYYCRFPVITTHGCNSFVSRPVSKKIITAPNNPDNTFDLYNEMRPSSRTIVDACYNWPQYTEVRELSDNILIFSLSKATGHAGNRLGWALIKDQGLADDLTQYVEETSMGVSGLTQDVGRYVLQRETRKYSSGDLENVFLFGETELKERWKFLSTLELPFKLLNSNGAFAWCEGDIPPHVEALPGPMFGGEETKFRLNLGCSRSDFFQLVYPYVKKEENDGPENM